jgi:hypothetical protein
MPKKRVIFCGGRGFRERGSVVIELMEYNPDDTIIVEGEAPGLDKMVRRLAKTLGFEVDPHPADWDGPCRPECKHGPRGVHPNGKTYCQAAGGYRNQEMLDTGIDEVVAFRGGKGTRDMAQRATDAGIPVRRISW